MASIRSVKASLLMQMGKSTTGSQRYRIHFGKLELLKFYNNQTMFRVADDLGKLRFQFSFFHKPLFGWKGSFVVTQVAAEKKVTFDHGIEGSIAEDCFFSMVAFREGFSFNFIEGMLELIRLSLMTNSFQARCMRKARSLIGISFNNGKDGSKGFF
jgi:hypothetical protein